MDANTEAMDEFEAIQTIEAQSCFLPGTHIQYAWDSTSLGYLKTCPRMYQYQMIEGWSAKGENIHLRYGIEIHRAFQDYDVSRFTGINHDDAVHDTIRALLSRIYDWEPEGNPEKRSEKVKTKDSLVRSVVWYLEKFKDDPAVTVTMQDGKPAVEVSFRFELDFGPEHDGETSQPYLLCGHLDRVVEFQGQPFVMDRKTTSSTPSSYYFNQFHPNNQMTLYTLATQVIFEAPVKGVIIDAIQIKEEGTEFTRGFTYRTPDQLDEWLRDLSNHLTMAEVYAEEEYWPQNDTACDKFGGCRFREVCSKSPDVRPNYLRSSFVQLPEEERWNPLKVR